MLLKDTLPLHKLLCFMNWEYPGKFHANKIYKNSFSIFKKNWLYWDTHFWDFWPQPPVLGQHYSASLDKLCFLQKFKYRENHAAVTPLWLVSLAQHNLWDSPTSIHFSVFHSFFLLRSIPVHGHTIIVHPFSYWCTLGLFPGLGWKDHDF